ncbi:MAG: AlpA family phage regulatory protein [Balneolaceae bacterium]|nr:AlpA family phage regulatory protein [Balneolaceae bacterium]
MNIIKQNDLLNKLNISRSTLWRLRNFPEYDFPKEVKISQNRIGWIEGEIHEWIIKNKK